MPAETQTGKMFRLQRQGHQGRAQPRRPAISSATWWSRRRCSLTARQRELLREFEAISQQDSARHNPRAKGWIEKVKEFFEG